jgi:shikimate kinase
VARVVLVGLPGTGKSAVATIVADSLEIPAVDTDRVLETKLPDGVASYLVNFGEAPFRREELRALADALGTDVVVSTGGGIVETPESRALLANQVVMWLDAPDGVLLPRLENGNRPLLGETKATGLATLRERRSALYAEVADFKIDCSVAATEVAARIVTLLGAQA